MAMKFDWNGKELFSYGLDRFLIADIKTDMQTDPFGHSVLLDEKHKLYLANVSDNRWAVVWQLGDDNTASMKYIFPMQFRTRDPEKLKELLFNIVPIASNGRFKLEDLVPELKQEAVPAAPQKPKQRPFTL